MSIDYESILYLISIENMIIDFNTIRLLFIIYIILFILFSIR